MGTAGKRMLVADRKIKKGYRKKEQASEEMAVMSTQVLMRTTALVDALPSDRPVTSNSGMQTERNITRVREN